MTSAAVETVGDMSGVTMGGAGRETTDRELSGGILADGSVVVLPVLFPVFPQPLFGESTG